MHAGATGLDPELSLHCVVPGWFVLIATNRRNKVHARTPCMQNHQNKACCNCEKICVVVDKTVCEIRCSCIMWSIRGIRTWKQIAHMKAGVIATFCHQSRGILLSVQLSRAPAGMGIDLTSRCQVNSRRHILTIPFQEEILGVLIHQPCPRNAI